jgi:DNA-binding response OmpR family regulator
MKVMICEEDISKAKVISDLLNVYQFKLVTLTQGEEFIKQVQSHKPAIIILNENFPSKSGADIVSQLRMHPILSNIPVIMISNSTNTNNVYNDHTGDSLFELMQEPFKIKHLRHCIDRWTTFRSLYVRQ